MMQAEKESCLEEVLPFLNSTKTKNGKCEYRVSTLVEEMRLTTGKNFNIEDVAQALRESVVATLKEGSGYTADKATGEIVYLLPGPDTAYRIKSALRSQSRKEYIKYLWRERIFPLLLGGVKVFIGFFLVFSLVILALALIALLAASKNRNGGGGGAAPRIFGHRRHGNPFWCPFRIFVWPWPVQAGGGGAAAIATGAAVNRNDPNQGMSFPEAIFSFIFGDGFAEPTEISQLATLRAYLEHRNGQKLHAIEFTPFLIKPIPLPPPSPSMNENKKDMSIVDDEKFMAPILTIFRGTPVATDDGKLSYVFPLRAREGVRSIAPKTFREKKMIFSMASPDQQMLALGLGVANLICLFLVWAQMRDEERLAIAVMRGGVLIGNAVNLVSYLFPILVLYSFTFLAIPGLRLLYLTHHNKQIDIRNELRELWSRRLQGSSFA